MPAQLRAIFAAVRSVVETIFAIRKQTFAAIAVIASTLAGCLPTPVPLAGADPADPGAKVSGVGYRSTIAPYTGLRPTAPSSWREQDDRIAPAPKSDQ